MAVQTAALMGVMLAGSMVHSMAVMMAAQLVS